MTSANLPFNPYGNYQVGSTVYRNKMEAAHYATLRKEPVTWDFHNDTFSKFDWRIKPPGTIRDLYRERAQQIRDTYDYVIVYFSGGSDSWTVLNSFLSNGIHVDEIRTNWAMDQRKFQEADPNNTHEVNIMSEFEYAILPVLDHVKKHYPKTSIVINDYSNEIQNQSFEEEYIHRSNHWQNLSSPFRLQGSSDRADNLINKYRKVAGVYGFEKIKVRAHNKKLYAFFADNAGGASLESGKAVEFFYSTPNFPLISIMQAHCLKEEIVKRREELQNPKPSTGDRDIWNDLYLSACYPDYNPNTFQTDKALGTWLRASDVWMQKYNPKLYDSWLWTYQQYFNVIDDSLIKNVDDIGVVGLKTSVSPGYLVDDNFDFPAFNSSLKFIKQ